MPRDHPDKLEVALFDRVPGHRQVQRLGAKLVFLGSLTDLGSDMVPAAEMPNFDDLNRIDRPVVLRIGIDLVIVAHKVTGELGNTIVEQLGRVDIGRHGQSDATDHCDLRRGPACLEVPKLVREILAEQLEPKPPQITGGA